MRIAIDARMYGPKITGIGNYVKYLTDAIFKIDQQNEYIIFLNEPDFTDFQPPSARVKKIKVNTHWYNWREQIILGLKYNRMAKKYNIDLFHFPQFNVPLTFRKNFVVTIHDITPKFFPGPKVKKSLVRKFAYNLVFNNAIKKAKTIITVSNQTKNDIVKYFKVNPAKIQVVYNGLITSFRKVQNYVIINELKNKYQLKKPFIFYTGVWRDHKNIPGLIAAFELLKNDYNLDIQLVLGGNSENQDPKIKPLLKKLNDPDIIIPGFIPENELSTFYTAASITVIPSFCEGFGMIATESIACETPVAASETTSIPEILGQGALYFNPQNPAGIAAVIVKILKNESLQNELVAKAKLAIKKFSWQTCAAETLSIYNSA